MWQTVYVQPVVLALLFFSVIKVTVTIFMSELKAVHKIRSTGPGQETIPLDLLDVWTRG